MKGDAVQISRADAEVIIAMMTEFFHSKELSEDETRALMSLCNAGNFGRPVPAHGSGP